MIEKRSHIKGLRYISTILDYFAYIFHFLID